MKYNDLCKINNFGEREVEKSRISTLRIENILDDILDIKNEIRKSDGYINEQITYLFKKDRISSKEYEIAHKEIRHHQSRINFLYKQLDRMNNEGLEFLINIAIEDGFPRDAVEPFRKVFIDCFCRLVNVRKELRHIIMHKLYAQICLE